MNHSRNCSVPSKFSSPPIVEQFDLSIKLPFSNSGQSISHSSSSTTSLTSSSFSPLSDAPIPARRARASRERKGPNEDVSVKYVGGAVAATEASTHKSYGSPARTEGYIYKSNASSLSHAYSKQLNCLVNEETLHYWNRYACLFFHRTEY